MSWRWHLLFLLIPVVVVAQGESRLRGVLIEVDETTGRARRITRLDEPGATRSCP